MQLPQRAIGDLSVSAIGLGAMPITATHDVDPVRAERAVHIALESGVTLVDTADAYGPTSEMGVNETALAAALASYPGDLDGVIVTTKGGHIRGPNATWGINGRPEHLAGAARESLVRLGVDAHPLYQLHRPDPAVPYAESCGAIRQLIDDGLVVRAGVSNVDEAQLEVAVEVLGDHLVSVQNQYSAIAREGESVLRRCEQLGLAFLAWGPLGGRLGAKQFGAQAPAFAEVARGRGVSPQQVGIAWLLQRSPSLIPIPGATRAESVLDTVAAHLLDLSEPELERLDALICGEDPTGG